MKVIVKHPGEAVGHEETAENTLEAFQTLVGGHIETITLDGNLVMVVNEEGRIRGLQRNIFIGSTTLVGTIVLAGRDGSEFTDCPIGINTWKSLLKIWGNPT